MSASVLFLSIARLNSCDRHGGDRWPGRPLTERARPEAKGKEIKIGRRVVRPVSLALMVPAPALGAAANAFADGNVSWRNAATGKYPMTAQGHLRNGADRK
ncbi:hypothetical protein Snoj_03370 [Streptomyces nojiriensis]|uniref:Uncharacterized protein n=1 Tax=Streptomyces nojiriensis TaxID=66374 RepID=A0ABQ3SE81_9ACTN|nr:hypothetical protein GCM10010205_49230 [Streptomyces nojiriensis]GHI66419.1 hypothetical protein Snoj_03370 [Streptomyces nojiriensis]